MQIEFMPDDLFSGVISVFRVVRDDNNSLGLEIEIKNDGLVTFWFRTVDDLRSFVGQINNAVTSLSTRETA